MTMLTQPLLAGKLEDPSSLKFPVYVTPKIDGIRCLLPEDKKIAVSRAFKPIKNLHIQSMLSELPRGFDGELVVPGASYNETQSAVMRELGEPDFHFLIFDYVNTRNNVGIDMPYLDRIKVAEQVLRNHTAGKDTFGRNPWIRLLVPDRIDTVEALMDYEEDAIAMGFEGVMVRRGDGPYKLGRSTSKEGILLKLKRFEDSEAIIVGFEEMMSNQNTQEQDAFGRSKRSSARDGLVPAGTLGMLNVTEVGNTPWKGKTFKIGTGVGLTQELRKYIWQNQDEYRGRTVTYKYQPHGVKDLPRLPILKGFRDLDDL